MYIIAFEMRDNLTPTKNDKQAKKQIKLRDSGLQLSKDQNAHNLSLSCQTQSENRTCKFIIITRNTAI